MYLTGRIILAKGINGDKDRYICYIRTPLVRVMKSSVRSRMEALTEALKELGLAM